MFFPWPSSLTRMLKRAGVRRSPSARARRLRPQLEQLEDRLAPATITVNSLADTVTPTDTKLTLRTAILLANGGTAGRQLYASLSQAQKNQIPDGVPATDPQNTIKFDLGAGVQTIQIGADKGLPLDEITRPVVIDGTKGGTSDPAVELDGSKVTAGDASARNGLTISAGRSTVKGLVIDRFSGYGIVLQKGGSNILTSNYIGTDNLGTSVTDLDTKKSFGNNMSGVRILNSSDNTVGGDKAGEGNVISGNQLNGIEITGAGSKRNVVQNNLIGTSKDGQRFGGNKDEYGNKMNGIVIQGQASENKIGAGKIALGNTISNNEKNGIVLTGNGTTQNWITGNMIGTDQSGAEPLANGEVGVLIQSAKGNLIGIAEDTGSLLGTGNVISGNGTDGVKITGAQATGNYVRGNFIGPRAGGREGLGAFGTGNSGNGVVIDGAVGNQIGGDQVEEANVISANNKDGILITGGAQANKVFGNLIGVANKADKRLGNFGNGVTIQSSSGNFIGLDDKGQGKGNVISGNLGKMGKLLLSGGNGIQINDIASTGNKVWGNIIGLNQDGSTALGTDDNFLGNAGYGVYLVSAGKGNIIGGTAPQQRNVISANRKGGVLIVTGQGNNQVLGNYIGTDASGAKVADAMSLLGNFGAGVEIFQSSDNLIQGNTISGNRTTSGLVGNGVVIREKESQNNKVISNKIGTNANGDAPLPNRANGVLLESANNTRLESNTISGNRLNGVLIQGEKATKNVLLQNRIGTDKDGKFTLAAGNGVRAPLGNGSDQVASGGDGVLIDNAPGNIIGALTDGLENIISGNKGNGVHIKGAQATGNKVYGNFIGTEVTGKVSDPNPKNAGEKLGNRKDGVLIEDAKNNIIGEDADTGKRNVICGNLGNGVQIKGKGATGNIVAGNNIGTNVNKVEDMSLVNAEAGVVVDSAVGNKVGLANRPNTIFFPKAKEGVHELNLPKGGKPEVRFNVERAIEPPKGAMGPQPQALGETVGILIENSADTLVEGNDITGLGSDGIGIKIVGAASTATLVESNFINGFLDGIVVEDAPGNVLGGTAAGAGNTVVTNADNGVVVRGLAANYNLIGPFNTIHDNGGDGVRVESGTSNAILSNSLFANGHLGINLVGGSEDSFGVTANHPGGAVPGPNHLQNYPDLIAATVTGDAMTVSGILESAPSTPFLLQFFSNSEPDPSGHGEGERLIGSMGVVTDQTGRAVFSLPFGGGSTFLGNFISATATDPAFNTSEFSGDIRVTRYSSLPPAAFDDRYTTPQDTPLRVSKPGILTNDTSPRGYPLRAILIGGPAHGKLVLQADGSFTYTPDPGFTGSDRFTYKANDGLADSNVATVTLTVTPIYLTTTTTTVSASPSPSVYGQSVSFTATVTAVPVGVGTPAGTVQFQVDGVNFGVPVLLTAGHAASASTSTLGAGTHVITANYGGYGTFSASTGNCTQTVTKAPLTITANNQNKVYGAALPALTANYSGFVNGDTAANLTTAPTLTTTATAASRVTGNPYAITASGAVAANYTISYIAGALTVTPAPLSMTANNQRKVYGAALPALTASYNGFVNGDTAANLTTAPTLTTTATANSPVGSYPITVSGAVDADYTITSVAGALTVTPASLTITANNQSKVYGAALPALTASYSGFVNGDTAANLTTAPTLTTAATVSSPVGSYAITASGAVAANYTINYLPGSLTVNQANTSTALASSANPAVYGQPVVFTATVRAMAPGAGTPTGTVDFKSTSPDGTITVTLGTGTLDASGRATFSIDHLVPGPHTVFASYPGDTNFTASASASMIQTINPGPATHFSVTAPASTTAGQAFSLTVTALDAAGYVASGYRGTVLFTSTDATATLPGNYSFGTADNGVHTFSNAVILRKAGARTLTATDAMTASITSSANVQVNAAAATHLQLLATQNTVYPEVPFTMTVTALDTFGNIATSYRGTVHFTNSDPLGAVAGNGTFTAADNGVHTFSGFVFQSPGNQSITVTDTLTPSITGTDFFTFISGG
jgi:parallel beta-helix repeat protein